MDELKALTDYGLAGAVIIALFYTLKVLGTLGLEKFEKAVNRFTEDARTIRNEHRDERAEWRASQEKMGERLDLTINGLTEAIKQGSAICKGARDVNRD